MASSLENLMKFGYALILAAIGLMVWASSVHASNLETVYPPCTFNALCTCSKAAPDLGIVQCKDVPFPAIPRTVNSSKVFILKMENTGLKELESHFLQATGLYRLEINNNPITDLPEDALAGLERSLWSLSLRHNQLIEIPTKSLRYLQKLIFLDLSGNQISTVEIDSFKGLKNSLQNLILADNSISELAQDAFQGLPNLESIDLSGNNLMRVDPSVFKEGMYKLMKVNFADNLLQDIPYDALSPLRSLRVLDISSNLISALVPEDMQINPNTKLALDILHLEYNKIEMIVPASFQYFAIVNQTFLDFNPIHMISDDGFQAAKIRELYMRHCKLNFVAPSAFVSLENSLQVLDMSGNNISGLPEKIFGNFDSLRSLSLKDNKLRNLSPKDLFGGIQYTLFTYDVSGDSNGVTNMQDLRKMKNLRSLAVSKTISQHLSPEDFLEFGVELENLKIFRGDLRGIKDHAFMHVRGLKRLDLSENRIDSIDKDAFEEIGHSLISLKISHGLSMTQLPVDAITHLTAIQDLDFSNNKIKSLSDTSFHFMRNLKVLEMNDNQIEQLSKGTFQSDYHSNLEEVAFAYNSIRHISQHTFVDLEKLRKVRLEDNKIERLERRAFMNLNQLSYLNLRGNKINSITDEAFQNLPELEHLDLAYNSLRDFDFDYFDQVGTLTALKVNVSHNKITELKDNSTTFLMNREHPGAAHSDIRVLDFSNNNITKIYGGYFKPTEISLTTLILSDNSITNVTRDVFGTMLHLQWLDLSNNMITDMASDSFRNSRNIQVLKLSNNQIENLPYDIFRYLNNLRIVELSNNNLRSLPDNLFTGDDLERLDLSHNQLTKIPVTSLANVAALTLCELDLSHNHIGAIHSNDLSNKFRSLAYLDLSNNRLVRLEDAAFATLPSLTVLDLSDNNELEVIGRAFIGLESSLTELSLENISLSYAPDLPLPNLRILKLSNNDLPTIPPELAVNMSSLRVLDLSGNDLTNVPLITHSLPQLRSLSLAGNPITTLSNTSLLGAADTLEHLDIAHFNLNVFEAGALDKLTCLRSLRLSTYPNIQNFNIPKVLENAENLRDLWIESPAPKKVTTTGKDGLEQTQMVQVPAGDLKKEMDGLLPSKLKNITISGDGFSRLAENIFRGVRSSILHLSFHNTSMTNLPLKLFQNIGNAFNLSVDIHYNNDQLSKIPNPNTAHYPHMPENVLLTDFNIHQNSLTCDCDIGWVEFWQRKKRQYFCSTQRWSDFNLGSSSKSLGDYSDSCDEMEDDDLRTARCTNKNNQQLLEILKTELECGWNASARLRIPEMIIFAVVFISLLI